MRKKDAALTFALFVLTACLCGIGSLCASTNPYPNTDQYYKYKQFNNQVNYRLFIPFAAVGDTSGTKYPVVIWLHSNDALDYAFVAGDPTQGNDNQMTDRGQFAFVTPEHQAIFPCFVIMPQRGPIEQSGGIPTIIHNLLQDVAANYPIDLDRVIITGQSGGGGNTKATASAYPGDFAAAIPVAAIGSATSAMAAVPTWAFHSVNDNVVGISASDTMIRNLRQWGGNPIYTRMATGLHEDAWHAVYDTPALYPWMAAQRRGVKQNNDPATITITAPTTASTFSSTSSSISFSGMLSVQQLGGALDPNITKVEWATGDYADYGTVNKNATGGTLTAWTGGPITLATPGTTTRVQVVASGTSWGGAFGGVTYYSKTLNFTYTNSGDIVVPVVTISSPTTGSTFTSGLATLSMSGTASDNTAVTRVEWTTDRGYFGTATGTTSWSIGSIPLRGGTNIVTVRGLDARGNMGTSILTVTSTLPLLTEPNNWSDTNLGSGLPGSSYEDPNGTMVTVRGSGSKMWGAANDYHYTYKAISGDCTIVARLTYLEPGYTNGDTSKIGLMFRESLTDATAKYVFMGTDYIKDAVLYVRPNTTNTWNDGARSNGIAGANHWFRLVRSGSTFTGSVAPDNNGIPGTWTVLPSSVVTFSSAMYVGFSVNSSNNTSTANAVFDNISVTGASTDTISPVVTITSPTNGATFTTPTLTMTGTASDNVALSSVTWRNAENSASGTISASPGWTVNNVPLVLGVNHLTVVAVDSSLNTTTASTTVTLSDTTVPAISVLTPTVNGGSITTTASAVTVTGTASDNIALANVTWTNSTTLATGTATLNAGAWTIGNLALDTGSNTIVVTARDTANNTNSATITVTSTGSGGGGGTGNWISENVGSPTLAGSTTFSGGTLTVSGSGLQIWDIPTLADQCRFVYQPITAANNICTISARLASFQYVNGYAVAGVMIRETTASSSAHMFMGFRPWGGAFSAWRNAGQNYSNAAGGTAAVGYYFQVVRNGNVFTASVSPSGAPGTWVQIGTTTTTMGSSVAVGFAVTSNDNTNLATACFDNITVAPMPPVWTSQAIGSPTLSGSFTVAGSTLTVSGSGLQIWDIPTLADQFQYVYQSSTSTVSSIMARLASFQYVNGNAVAGVMIRETTASSSAHMFMGFRPWSGAFSAWRNAGQNFSNAAGGTAAVGYYFQVVRNGNVFTASASPSGAPGTWVQIGTTTTTMGSSVTVGFAVTSNDNTNQATAVFDHITVSP